MTENKTNKKHEIIEITEADKSSRWSKFTSNKWYLGLAALALLGAGGIAGVGATSALVYSHQTEAVHFMNDIHDRFDDDSHESDWEDRYDWDDRDDDADDRAEVQAFSQLATKLDFKTAMETALKEAGSGFVTSASLDLENGKAVYEVETFDGQTEKDYTIDAESGALIRSRTDQQLDAEDKSLTQPQKSVHDILTAHQDKYKDTKVKDISLDQDRSGKWIYEVDFLDGNSMKTARYDANEGSFISEESDRD